MNWEVILKRGPGLKQFQKDLIDEIMSDEKPRSARDVIEDWFDLIAARRKGDKSLSGIPGDIKRNHGPRAHLTNNSVAPYSEVNTYLERSSKYVQVGEHDMGSHSDKRKVYKYKAGGQDDLV